MNKKLFGYSILLCCFLISQIDANYLYASELKSGNINISHANARGEVKNRMKLMKSYASAMKNINKSLQIISEQSRSVIKKHARMIAISASKLNDLFPSGSGGGVSEASPDIWEKPEGFKKLIILLANAAKDLEQQAESTDKSGLFLAFRNVGRACKDCHMAYRVKKGS